MSCHTALGTVCTKERSQTTEKEHLLGGVDYPVCRPARVISVTVKAVGYNTNELITVTVAVLAGPHVTAQRT